MPKSIAVEINPKVLVWLRESSGWKLEEVGKNLNTNVEIIKDFELGKKNPTLKQLKLLSKAFKRPLASFFLSEPKEQKPLPRDYRMIPGREGVFDKKTILTIRRARNLQMISKELSLNISYETKPKIEKIRLSDNPEMIGKKYRDLFDLTEKKQRRFRNSYELFNYLRDILEDINIIVFQFSMPVEDARGFTLVDDFPAVIVVNSKDSIEARLFSLMHEFAHILLGETVIDIPKLPLKMKNKIEKWCSEFASSFLLPTELAKEIFREQIADLIKTETLNSLSRKYKVSKAMLLFRMLKMNQISELEYDEVLERYQPEETLIGPKKEGVMGILPDKKCLSERGNKFVSLVANNFDRNYITYTDVLDYLSIKSRSFQKVLVKARK